MSWLGDLIRNNPIHALLAPSVISAGNFFANLFVSLSDGNLDTNELHNLMSSANGVQLLILMFVMMALKSEKK